MKNKLLFGLVFIFILSFTSILATDFTVDNSLWLTAIDSASSDSTFYGTPEGSYDGYFNGVDDYIDTGISYDLTSIIILEANVTFNDLTVGGILAQKGSNSDSGILMDWSGTEFRLWGYSGSTLQIISGGTAIVGQEYNVKGILDSGVAYLYVDDILIDSGAVSWSSTTANILIGAWSRTPHVNFINAIISDVSINIDGTEVYSNSLDQKSIKFDGTTDYIDTGIDIGLDYDININLTFDSSTSGISTGIFTTVYTTSARDGIQVSKYTDDKLRIVLFNSNSATVNSNALGPILTDNQLHNIRIKRYSSNGSLYAYLDNVLVLTDTSAGQTTNDRNVFLGVGYITSGPEYKGNVYNFEIKNHLGAITYQLNATSLSDWSGNGNDASIGTSGQTLLEDSWDFDFYTGNDYNYLKSDTTDFNTLDDFTFHFWLNDNGDIGASEGSMFFCDRISGNVLSFSLTGTNQLPANRLKMYDGSSYYSDDVVLENQFNLVSYVRNSNILSFYINGVFSSSVDIGTTSYNLGGFNLGAYFGDIDRYGFNGQISTFAGFLKSSSSTEVAEFYAEGIDFNPYATIEEPSGAGSNFTVSLDDFYTSGSLTDFTITINGTEISDDGTGTAITTILSNSTSLWDITVEKTNYVTREYINVNVTTNLTAILVPFFEITLKETYADTSLTDFTATINTIEYTDGGTGTIITDIDRNSTSTFTILIEHANSFDITYTDYDVSTNLDAETTQTDITFGVYVAGTSLLYDIDTIYLRDNNIVSTISSTDGYFDITPNANVNISFDLYVANLLTEDSEFSYIFTGKETSEYSRYLTLKNNTVTYLDNVTGFAITNAEITITYPSGTIEVLYTDVLGNVYFDFELNGAFEFGEYSFKFDKLGYTVIIRNETIDQADLLFSTTYNMGRTSLFIDIYDRLTGLYMTQLVDLQLLGVFTNSTLVGQYVYTDLTLASGEYTIQAVSSGYATTEKTFTFTNQETLTVDLFMLNTSIPSAGTIFVEVIDQNYIKRPSVTVSLLEYDTGILDYIKVDEAISNSNGEVVFNVELNDKRYIISGTITIDGQTYTDQTDSTGVIFKTDNDVVFLKLEKSETSFTNTFNNLVITINETYTNNISNINAQFYRTDGLTTQICIEYYLLGINEETSIQTDCTTSSMALIGLTSFYSLNRSNTYEARVSEIYGGINTLLITFLYPSEDSLEEIFGNYNYIGIILILSTVGIIAISFALNKLALGCFLLPLLHWSFALKFFPNKTYMSVAVLITFICIFIFKEIRIKQEVQ